MSPILKIKHNKDCSAVRAVKLGIWENPWAYPESVWANQSANQTPSRRGYVSWLKVRCNDSNCPAEVWIPSEEFLGILPSGI